MRIVHKLIDLFAVIGLCVALIYIGWVMHKNLDIRYENGTLTVIDKTLPTYLPPVKPKPAYRKDVFVGFKLPIGTQEYVRITKQENYDVICYWQEKDKKLFFHTCSITKGD